MKDSYVDDVKKALLEDVATGDITAGLLPKSSMMTAQIISREEAICCGQSWVNEVYRQLDRQVSLEWQLADGDQMQPNQVLCVIEGRARSLLTGERCALNFLQTLSGTATVVHDYVQLIKHTPVKLLDTRKTLPGLRAAQKYAVRCGGGDNHRQGLFDAVLIKENHIRACGSITAAVETARQQQPGKTVEVEVENLLELQEAIEANPDIIMLDNFSLEGLREAVAINLGRIKLEASGGVSRKTLVAMAETGVDYISVGAVTKHVRAIDLSMQAL